MTDHMLSYTEQEYENSRALETSILAEMDKYWTPVEGHKISRRATIEKWSDFVRVAQSCLRTAYGDSRIESIWTRMEVACQGDLTRFQAA